MAQADRKLSATPRFLKSKRALKEEEQLAIDDEVRAVVNAPLIGEPKTGALKGVRVRKFKVGPRQYLLAYVFTSKANRIEFLDVGVHENFYRDLQNYLGER